MFLSAILEWRVVLALLLIIAMVSVTLAYATTVSSPACSNRAWVVGWLALLVLGGIVLRMPSPDVSYPWLLQGLGTLVWLAALWRMLVAVFYLIVREDRPSRPRSHKAP